MKNKKLNQWLWKWHFIGGIVSVPFVLVLSVTGAIYLFKGEVEAPYIANIQSIHNSSNEQLLPYQAQLEIASRAMEKPLNEMVLSEQSNQSTEFVSGKFSHKQSIYVNPYTGEVAGKFSPKDTWMYSVRKLHGELLGGKVGTKFVELIACWAVVLLLTGLYIWFPLKNGKLGGVFTIRRKMGKQIFFRDLHAVTGFWTSLLLLLTLAGGLPWTDVFGSNFKTIQKWTNTGYPASWMGIGLSSQVKGAPLSLDEMVQKAQSQKLDGVVTIGLPKNESSTFSVSNSTFPLSQQKMLHFDQYSGNLVKEHHWSDVGILMRGRMWVMAFHQGQLGQWNWWLMFLFAIALTIMSASAIVSYWLRKPLQAWGVPKVPSQFKVGKGVLILIGFLAVLFPLFGLSLLLIWLGKAITSRKNLV
ncbi:MAG: PepSY domain-containing protein [Chitinophagales bacterium]|nr:PepSY domain-containing protein [Chitinophagales bacterium]